MLAAGADLTDLDIVSEPLASPADLEGRMSAWLADVDSHEGGREKAVVAHFGLVKKSLTEAGKDFSVYVEAPCHRSVFRSQSARVTGDADDVQAGSGGRAGKYHLECYASWWCQEVLGRRRHECTKEQIRGE